MAFQLSPGVNVSEIDLTTVVPSVATSDGAIAGLFRWGPVGERVQIDSENALVNMFGKPKNSYNPETFFTAANFLSYSNSLYVSRAANTTGITPVITANSIAGATNAVVSTNVISLAAGTGNTANLVVGMYVSQTNTSYLNAGKDLVITAITNSSAFQINKNISIPAGQSVPEFSLYFAHPETSYNALGVAAGGYVSNLVGQIIKNQNDLTSNGSPREFDTNVMYSAKYPGDIGNSLRVSVCDSANAYNSNLVFTAKTITVGQDTTVYVPKISFTIGSSKSTVEYVNASSSEATLDLEKISIGDKILAGNSSIGFQNLLITDISVNTSYQPDGYTSANTLVTFTFEEPYRLHTSYTSNAISRFWEFHNLVDGAPGTSSYVATNGNTAATDELHVVVVDDAGQFTGTPGTVLEVFKGLSRATDAKNLDGSVNYYANVINQSSAYVWWTNDSDSAASANAALISNSLSNTATNLKFKLGADGFNETDANNFAIIAKGYDLFSSAEDIDISLVLQGYPLGPDGASYQLANYLIDNIAEIRKDVVVFVSPDKSLTLNAFGTEAADLVDWRNNLHSSSYAVMDSGYKYQYDRYNDIYRWTPLNGDVAGLCARTDNTNDAWWSPAGFNRGQIKNLIKLAYNPKHTARDTLYKNGINPVVTFPGQGTVLYGDKTLQAKPSAFDRINVRRLFIVLEKAISTAAKYSLFEFNDAFTRSQFKNLVTPYLRTIQGRRGITDFLVVCDDTNNTPQIIDTNQFVGDIYIKPARSINFIQLNFVAVATGVQFSEVVGKF